MKKTPYIPHPERLNRSAFQTQGSRQMGCIYHNYARNLPPGEFSVRSGIFVLNYVLHGTGHFRTSDGKKHPITAGSVVQFASADDRHLYISPEEEFIECSFFCNMATYEQLRQMKIVEDTVPVFEIGLQTDAVAAYFDLFDAISAKNSNGPPVRKLAHYLDELYRPLERKTPDTPLIREACRLLSLNPGQKLSLEKTARQLGVSYHEFRKTFKAATGISPGAYRIRQKLDHACHELISGKTVQQIAVELGYIDPFHFSRQFKQYIGTSPLRFRQMHKRNPHLPVKKPTGNHRPELG